MSLQNLVIDSAKRSPDAIAIVDTVTSMTYRELDSLANRIARAMQMLGISAGNRVGIWLDKSVYSVVVMQAVLRLGAVYVPLDPLNPAARVRTIINDCSIQLLVTTEKCANNILADETIQLPCLCIKGNCPEMSWQHLLSLSDLPIASFKPDENDLAYILYTSGSTGKPKGVCITHSNALAFINWAGREIDATSGDRFANHAPFHFDPSVLDLYVAFKVGASVHLIPDELSYIPQKLVDFIIQEKITIWYSVPSAIILMMQQGGLLNVSSLPLRIILFGGESFPIKHLRQLFNHWQSLRLLNVYGPTETNVCTFYEVKQIHEEQTKPIPIGRACSGNKVWAVKDDGTRVESGEKGELMVAGPTVMHGYWGQPKHGDKPYATGDIVQLQPDGNYFYIGRRDHMVKVRGYRVELEEIEAVLEELNNIQEVAVVVSGQDMRAKLIAFIVLNQKTLMPSILEIKQHCAERLPRYMIVDDLQHIVELPRTRNGKIDRQKLNIRANLIQKEREIHAVF